MRKTKRESEKESKRERERDKMREGNMIQIRCKKNNKSSIASKS